MKLFDPINAMITLVMAAMIYIMFSAVAWGGGVTSCPGYHFCLIPHHGQFEYIERGGGGDLVGGGIKTGDPVGEKPNDNPKSGGKGNGKPNDNPKSEGKGKSKGNASANNGKGGNYGKTGHSDNGKGEGRNKK